MVKEHAYKPKRQHKPQPKKRWVTPGILVGIFLGFLMVTSIFGFLGAYTSNGSGGTLDYNGHTFQQTALGYTTTINDISLEFSYFPDSVAHLNVSQDIVDLIKSTKALTVTYDPVSPINQSAGLIQFNLEQLYDKALGIYVTRSLTDNSAFPTLANATCADATPYVPVILLEQGDVTQVSLEGSCIHMTAIGDQDLVRIHDLLAYRLLGVI